MSYLFSFLLAGLICLIGQIIYSKTKLTPGHITSLFVIIGVILSFFGLYDYLVEYAEGGASILITNYGHLLYSSGLKGLQEGTLLNALMNLMVSSSATLSFTIFIGFVVGALSHYE